MRILGLEKNRVTRKSRKNRKNLTFVSKEAETHLVPNAYGPRTFGALQLVPN